MQCMESQGSFCKEIVQIEDGNYPVHEDKLV